jgi:hypothetical protein
MVVYAVMWHLAGDASVAPQDRLLVALRHEAVISIVCCRSMLAVFAAEVYLLVDCRYLVAGIVAMHFWFLVASWCYSLKVLPRLIQ